MGKKDKYFSVRANSTIKRMITKFTGKFQCCPKSIYCSIPLSMHALGTRLYACYSFFTPVSMLISILS